MSEEKSSPGVTIRRWFSAAALLISLLAAPVVQANPVADFYRGKQIQMVIGYGPGGGYDLNARLVARHIGAFIPGNPSVVAQNMPGAGSVRAAHFVHAVAPRDGTVIAALDRLVPLSAVLGGNPAIKFPASEMQWLGTASSYANDSFILWVRKDAAAKTLEDLLRAGGPDLKVGRSVGASDDVSLTVLRDVLGLRLSLITGYPDGNAMSLALERGEIDARTVGYSAIAATRAEWLRPDSIVRPLLQIGRKTRFAALPDVAIARELARDERSRAIIEVMEMPYQLARPFMLSPSIPPERLAALQKAFVDAVNSQAFKDDAARINLDVSPLSGPEVARLVADMANAPPEALAYLRKLVGDGQ